WLGTAFDPQLEGYFGSADTAEAAETLLRIIEADPAKISGVKMSLLDDEAEIAVRERLPDGVMMLTGDDYHFSHLIVGDGTATTEVGAQQVAGEYSDALLGAFAATAPAASARSEEHTSELQSRFDLVCRLLLEKKKKTTF